MIGGTNSVALTSPKRHPSLYINDETVIIRVENTLYRVHTYFLKRHSAFFATAFSLPQKEETEKEGSSDERPIYLEQVSAVDFERLLSLFYPVNVSNGDLITVEEWSSILGLATKFEFDGFRALAIDRLTDLATPVERILLARKYDVANWLVPAYTELCRRPAALTLEEGERLGMRDVVVLSEIRQYLRGANNIRASHTDQAIRSLLAGPGKLVL